MRILSLLRIEIDGNLHRTEAIGGVPQPQLAKGFGSPGPDCVVVLLGQGMARASHDRGLGRNALNDREVAARGILDGRIAHAADPHPAGGEAGVATTHG